MTYVFRCKNCNKIYEVEMSMKDLDTFENKSCPECGSSLKRDYQSEHKSGIPIFFVGKDFFVNEDKNK